MPVRVLIIVIETTGKLYYYFSGILKMESAAKLKKENHIQCMFTELISFNIPHFHHCFTWLESLYSVHHALPASSALFVASWNRPGTRAEKCWKLTVITATDHTV